MQGSITRATGLGGSPSGHPPLRGASQATREKHLMYMHVQDVYLKRARKILPNSWGKSSWPSMGGLWMLSRVHVRVLGRL